MKDSPTIKDDHKFLTELDALIGYFENLKKDRELKGVEKLFLQSLIEIQQISLNQSPLLHDQEKYISKGLALDQLNADYTNSAIGLKVMDLLYCFSFLYKLKK